MCFSEDRNIRGRGDVIVLVGEPGLQRKWRKKGNNNGKQNNNKRIPERTVRPGQGRARTGQHSTEPGNGDGQPREEEEAGIEKRARKTGQEEEAGIF